MKEIVYTPFSEKIGHFRNALKEHQGLIFLFFFFALFGSFFCVLFWPFTKGGAWVPFLIGAFFVVFPFVAGAMTLPSSLSYYYEKSLSKKYGKDATAIVTDKSAETNTFEESSGRDYYEVEETTYCISYRYSFAGEHEGAFYVENGDFYDKIEIGSKIPIRVLAFKPETSYPRRVKLGKSLGFKKSETN